MSSPKESTEISLINIMIVVSAKLKALLNLLVKPSSIKSERERENDSNL